MLTSDKAENAGSPRQRRLPSLDGMRMFEAAARHLSFTLAADEMCVTQGAVSQRMKALEAELGVALFKRQSRGLALTAEGQSLSDGVRVGIAHIAGVVATFSPAEKGALTISVLPSFASRWLIPRLRRFTALYPDAQVQVRADIGLADLRDPGVHAALRFGTGNYPRLSSTMLLRDAVAPVCSPHLLAELGPIESPADLRSAPILNDSSTEGDGSGSDWASWLAATGAETVRLRMGQRFSQADMTLDAAVNGLGVALARISLARDDLASGRLVRLSLPVVPTIYAYYLVCRPELAAERRVSRFRDWLLTELGTSP